MKSLVFNTESAASRKHLKVDNPATIDLSLDETTNRVRFFQNEDEDGYQPAKTMEGWDKSPAENRSIIKSKPLFIQINETQTPSSKKKIQIGNSGRETELKRQKEASDAKLAQV